MTPEEKQEIIDAVLQALFSDSNSKLLDITGLDAAQSLNGISTFPAVLTTTNNGVTTKVLVSVPISLLTQAIQDVITNANTAASSARSAAAGWAAAAVKMGSDIVVIEGNITNLQDADKSISTLTAYAECSTAANVSAKAVTVPFYTLPTNGGCLHIKMEHANTAVSGVTFNINATGAKDLLYNGSAVSATNTWQDNEVLEIYYDGTNYQATNAQGGGGSADNISYDNSESGLNAETVQSAIDRLARLVNNNSDARLVTTVEEGFYIVDSDGNIGLKLDENGFDIAAIATHLQTLIQNISGGGSSGGGETIIVGSEKSWTANILLIGNSYSADAVAYLPKLFEMTNLRDFTVGILYNGGSALAYHKNSLTGTANTYTYWEFTKTNGYWSQETSVDIFTGIDKKRWDFILTHQLSNDSTNITKIDRDLPIIISKIKEYLNESYVPKFGYVLTPAWGHTNSSYSDPAQSDTMWEGINNVGKHILELKSTTYRDIDLLVPIHTAIQNARTNATLSEYGADLQVKPSDKHIERGIGRLIQAFTFYKSIQEYFRNDADWSADYIWKPINGTNVIRADYTAQTTTWFPLNDNTNGDSFNTITDTALASAINAVKLAVWNSWNVTTIK